MRLFVFLPVPMLVLFPACGSNDGQPKPVIQIFSAQPLMLPVDGGTATLSWTVTDATSLTVDQGVGAVTPSTSGTKVVPVTSTTTFTLTASGAGGSASSAATVTVCDAAGLGGTCHHPPGTLCVEFSNLSSQDLASVQTLCGSFGGTFDNAACSSDLRVGRCQASPPAPRTGPTCSPQGTITLSYYVLNWNQSSAEADCQAQGGVFTPG